MESGKPKGPILEDLVTPDGSLKWFETYKVPWRDQAGDVVGIIGISLDITHRIVTENRLRESEKKLKLAQRIASIGNWSWDVEHDRVEWSDEVYRIFKSPLKPPSYEFARSFVHPADLDRWEREVANAIAEQRPFAMECRTVRTDGKAIWVRNETRTVSDGEGRFVGYEGTVQDITARKEAETRLELFKRIVESSQIAVAVSDPEGRLIHINPAHTRLFGRSLEEFQNTNYREFYPPESVDVLDRVVAPALARGEDWEGILDAFDAKGRRFPLWERASTVRDSEGKMVCAFGFMQDVTEQRRVERDLEERETFLSALIEAMPVPVFYKDRKGAYLGFNRAFEELSGANREQLIGKTVFDLDFGWRPEFHHDKDKEVMECGEYFRYESRVTNMRGQMREVIFTRAPFWGLEGTVKGVVGAILDITDQKRMQRLAAAIAEAERITLRRELHDTVCQGLAGAGILADHLREDLGASSDDSAKRVDEIAQLIRQSLNKAHLIGRQMEPLSDAPDALINALEDLSYRIMGLREIRCRITSRKRVEIRDRAIANQLWFIAQEAAFNAAKHAHGTFIGISLSRRGRAVVLRIRDNGKGLSKKEKKEIGMGIKIMHERAELIGAKLAIKQSKNGGTTVECVWNPPVGKEV